MKELPIMMSPPMAKAAWDGDKTQTRRLAINKNAQRYVVGGRLWVREQFYLEEQFDELPPNWLLSSTYKTTPVWYGADGEPPNRSAWDRPFGKKRPSLHLPRWGCRMLLTVENIRLQALQDITEDDARAEGVKAYLGSYVAGFSMLWSALNNKPGRRWEDNPAIIAVTFSREKLTQQNNVGGYRENRR